MNSFFLAVVTNQEALSSLASVWGMIWFLGLLLAILYVLFPLIVVVQLGSTLSRLKKLQDRLEIQEKKQEQQFLENFQELGNCRNIQEFQLKEAKNQNQLTRQLLRAYGHEPEV